MAHKSVPNDGRTPSKKDGDITSRHDGFTAIDAFRSTDESAGSAPAKSTREALAARIERDLLNFEPQQPRADEKQRMEELLAKHGL